MTNNCTATVPVYDWVYDDGVSAGCGTAAEFNHWSEDGCLPGLKLGAIIAHEPASEDVRRAAAWARIAA